MGNLVTNRRRLIAAQRYDLLPPWYQQVQYLQSSGTQYIATDLVPTFLTGDEMYIRIALVSTSPATSILFGIQNENIGSNVAIQLPSISRRLRCDLTGLSYFGYCTYDEWFEWTASGKSISCLGTTYTANDAVENATKELVLFAQKMSSTEKTNAHCRISGMWYKRNGEYIVRLIPAIREGVAGMYDTVSGKFYTNGGTGTFTTGPTV